MCCGFIKSTTKGPTDGHPIECMMKLDNDSPLPPDTLNPKERQD